MSETAVQLGNEPAPPVGALYQQAIQESKTNGSPCRPYWDISRDAGERTR